MRKNLNSFSSAISSKHPNNYSYPKQPDMKDFEELRTYTTWISYSRANQNGIGRYENKPKGVSGSASTELNLSCPEFLDIMQGGENASLTFPPSGPTILLEADAEVDGVHFSFAGHAQGVDYYGDKVDVFVFVKAHPMESFLTVYFRPAVA